MEQNWWHNTFLYILTMGDPDSFADYGFTVAMYSACLV